MHYVPPSFQSLAEPQADGDAGENRAEADLAVAPSLLLALLVALLLGADYVLTLVDTPAWLAWRSVLGFRLAFWAAILGGAKILYRTLEGLFEGRVGADLALTIACGAALLLGEPAVAAWGVLIALGGEALENLVASRARSAIGGLFDLRPRIVHRVRDGQDEDVPLEQIAPGDTVVVRPGERIPVDGVVLIGRSAVDQSSLTGESWPVDREEGDAVYTGTLNQFGALTISVQRVGSDTTYGQILRLVAEAAQRKCGLERTADRLARYFLPAVLIAAGATLLGWRIAAGNWRAGWMPALAVLVVACPCPLILATPSAVLAALARLAKMGVLIKGSAALERLAGVDQFAFDKTGTLTAGCPELGTLISLGNFSPRDLLRVAAAAERHSEHLLGRLLVAAAHAENAVIPQIGDFEAQPGAGVTARVRVAALPPDWMTSLGLPVDRGADCRVIVGNRRLLEANGVQLDEYAQAKLAELDASGQTPLLVAIERRIIGLIGVRDAVRSEARDVLSELRAAGIRRCALLTGDRAAPARRVVETLGFVGPICPEMSPLDKAHWIEEQTRAGSRVAMVGDGVNDAPALAAADVGLALGGVGSQLAAEAGDIVLMGDPLAPLPGLLRLSREFVRIIQQGVFLFAFGVNGIGVILSAWGALNPVAAALFHEAASILVMLNALRLLWFENWQTTRTGRTLAAAGDGILAWASRLSPARWGTWLLVEWKLVLRLAAAAAG
ncbi:MAG TPA: cation-translocating P-type ATPase, partial [Planctomycetaceae bacterium]|nr:cation-translocating P-type ATPase [Planctomycetaceae bacterium]